jgi:hypothetical protein
VADWVTISSLATAGGTLILALATFASVRSANRAVRTAERALLAGLRPVLVPSRLQDLEQKILWVDGHWTRLGGGQGGVEVVDDVIYLSMPLRNVGAGLAVLQGWYPWPEWLHASDGIPEPDGFRRQNRDLYVPPGDIGFWQGAIRGRDDDGFAALDAMIASRQPFTVDLLYSDHEGGQRTVSRFAFVPRPDQEGWLASGVRHWSLDRPDPR